MRAANQKAALDLGAPPGGICQLTNTWLQSTARWQTSSGRITRSTKGRTQIGRHLSAYQHLAPEYSQMADIQRSHHVIDQGSDADTRHAASASASRARPRGDDKKASHSRGEGYINPTRSYRVIQPLSDSQTTSKPFTNSTSRDVEMAATTTTRTNSTKNTLPAAVP